MSNTFFKIKFQHKEDIAAHRWLYPLRWGTADVQIKVPSADNTKLSKGFLFLGKRSLEMKVMNALCLPTLVTLAICFLELKKKFRFPLLKLQNCQGVSFQSGLGQNVALCVLPSARNYVFLISDFLADLALPTSPSPPPHPQHVSSNLKRFAWIRIYLSLYNLSFALIWPSWLTGR